MKARLLEAIGEYFDLGVAEGREGRTHDTRDGAAQRKLRDIEGLVDQMSSVQFTAPGEPCVDEYQRAMAVLYQVLGALEAPERVLDIALALANGQRCAFDPMSLLPFQPASPLGAWRATVVHRKGGRYQEVARALLEVDLSEVVVYRGVDGRVWVRPLPEFLERFSPLPSDLERQQPLPLQDPNRE
jgi:hypothetical protein